MKKLTHHSGFTILEILVALAISSILMIAGVQLSDVKSQDITDQNTAQYHAMINNAAMKYIQSISSAVKSDASITLTTPRTINFNEIKTAGFIPKQFENATTNPYGQSICVFVYKDPANINDISALVVSEGGQDIPMGRLPNLSTLIGPAGGYIHPNTPTTAIGSYGKWTKPIPNLSCSGQRADENHIASQVYFDGSDLTQNYLYRSEVPGHPEANEMNTPLVMNAESTKDDVCTKLGSISRSSTGELLACSGTSSPYTWKASSGSTYWKDPVETYANLVSLPCTATESGETRVVKAPTVGTGARAYTCSGTGTWSPLSSDDNGNLTIAGEALINKLSGNLEITTVVVDGSVCSTNGRIARDASGLILSCQSGSWKKVATLGVSSTYTTPINGACNSGSYAIGSQTSTVCTAYATTCTPYCSSGFNSMSGWVCLSWDTSCAHSCSSQQTGTTTTCANP
ncbi:MAG: hypothetical protein CTY35_04780 [Methylotenera sp.]|uniref:shufflon system plasmid conjugative transfer pilus tip adhesin PilV n=1 Tax=Methylotenera sp. TaxID=2051956 RepID=UPI000D4DC011|nr:shufflon system plasmid conjugative transfer pilus tip adhesin PilV [Methylotenera sp.]PPC81906.1 MAG: hypothetical protein CTY38_07755 [Methylotenera sp.]PPC98869.1 MAG: hypothetical protein CTY35_04780 [Methylotenera sp.]